MKNTYIILLALLLTSISYSQKINDDNTGFIDEITLEIDKTEASERLNAWARKRYKTKESELNIDEDIVTAKSFISMAFRFRTRFIKKIDEDLNYKFYYNLEVSSKSDKVIIELTPTEVDIETPGFGYSRIDNYMYEYLITEEPLDITKYKELSIRAIDNSKYPKAMKKKNIKLIEKQIDTSYKDYLVNIENYKSEVKAIFDSAKRALSTE